MSYWSSERPITPRHHASRRKPPQNGQSRNNESDHDLWDASSPPPLPAGNQTGRGLKHDTPTSTSRADYTDKFSLLVANLKRSGGKLGPGNTKVAKGVNQTEDHLWYLAGGFGNGRKDGDK
ncbi:hypothetical protein HK104_005166, partial [Borealophlyctis nickersoniae]